MSDLELDLPPIPESAKLEIEQESRQMFVARLENMQTNGYTRLTIVAVLALQADCDMLAQQSYYHKESK